MGTVVLRSAAIGAVAAIASAIAQAIIVGDVNPGVRLVT